ncbi:hypothetical protein [Streptomyces sp. NPDC006739]|uniref:hypothetical protein n=1 Tax=Streptomyces sp. NPDC006739 TaxID=3364763 RepID=UPI0036B46053
MTSTLSRGRPRHATARIRVRVVRALLGGVAAVVWLVLPVMTIAAGGPVPAAGAAAAPVAGAAAPHQDETSVADLVLPLAALAVVAVLAGYGYVRRTRRARTRTTPGLVSVRPPVPSPVEAERQARAALVVADDCVRTSREELAFTEPLFEAGEAEPFVRALRAAETELAAAFAIWRRYEEGVPGDEAARRQALAGVVGRCAEAGRRLDAAAGDFDRLRGTAEAALEAAEGRFRELAARAGRAQTTLTDLARRYGALAVEPVAGYVEQAKDRLVFATTHLNQARQSGDSGHRERADRDLRAAEGAVAQAGVLVTGVERLAGELREAADMLPAALTGGEAEIAAAREAMGKGDPPVPAGELHARLAHADGVLAAVRRELTGAAYDPLDALRRVVRAVSRLEVGRAGVTGAGGLLVARSSVAGAEDFVSAHRGAVGAEARARLATAGRLLGAGDASGADASARQARELAERDVRAHGNPYAGTAEHASGLAGAVLGGILLAEEPDGGPPASFGGPRTRGRRRLP